MTSKLRAALLIDADNLPATQVREALDKLEQLCNPVIRKAFGDFTGSAKNWTHDLLLKTGITPVQHFPVSRYKNGADIAMCIAAMDIVHTRNVEAIVLFSSDSDFGPLASRIRETGMEVIGIGDQQTSDTFRASFDKFIVVAAPANPSQVSVIQPKKSQPKSKTPTQTLPVTPPTAEKPREYTYGEIKPSVATKTPIEIMNQEKDLNIKFPIAYAAAKAQIPPDEFSVDYAGNLIIKTLKTLNSESGWYSIGALGKALSAQGFDRKKYKGGKTLTGLLQEVGKFEFHTKNNSVYVKRK